MRLSEFEAVIFDNDGVLVDSEAIHIAVEMELLAELGLQYDYHAYLTRFMGLSPQDYKSALVADFAAQADGRFPADFDSRLAERVWPRLRDELVAIPGARELVMGFGGPVAVASSAPIDRLMSKLKTTDQLDIFAPHIYSADHVKSGKPAPDLFLHAAKSLGVSPSSCVVIEDSVNGVLAGRAAGMTTIGFVGGSHADGALKDQLIRVGAGIVVESHAALLKLL